jgi:hypothetical protein
MSVATALHRRVALHLTAVLIALLMSTVTAAADSFSGCFTRIYDREHLGKHPEQLVKLMHLQVNKNGSEPSYSFVVFVGARGYKTLAKFDGTCVLKSPRLECEAGDARDPTGPFFLTRQGSNMMLYLNYFYLWQGMHITKGADDSGTCGKWRYNN